MPFNVNEFSSNINQFGVAKPSHFNVLISLGRGSGLGSLRQRQTLRGFTDKDMEHLAFRCIASELPGMLVAGQEQRTYGPIRRFAYGVIEDDITMTFLCSKNLREKVFFEEWAEFITGIIPNAGGRDKNTYNVRYYDEYVTDISIEQYDEQNPNQPSYSIKLIDAYPVSIAAMPLDRDSTDEFHRVSITFSYHRWERQEWRDKAMETAAQSGLFGRLGGVFGAGVGVAASFVSPRTAQIIAAAATLPGAIRGISDSIILS